MSKLLCAFPLTSTPLEYDGRNLQAGRMQTTASTVAASTAATSIIAAAAEEMRSRLVAAGMPRADTRILAPPDGPGDGALFAVLHGRDAKAKPILLLAHIDVVEAKRSEWQRDPFKLVGENGWFYARGASDDKAMAAVFTDNLWRRAPPMGGSSMRAAPRPNRACSTTPKAREHTD